MMFVPNMMGDPRSLLVYIENKLLQPWPVSYAVPAILIFWLFFFPISPSFIIVRNFFYRWDWCCFMHNSLVVAGSSICLNLFRFEFSMCFQSFINMCACVCARPLSPTKSTSAHSNQALVPASCPSSCAVIIHVCLCMYAYVCTCVHMWRKG